MRLLTTLLLLCACERVSMMGVSDARPPARADGPPSRPDAAPARADAPPPDALAQRPDAAPGPRRREKDEHVPASEACDSDADCTIYGDPCGKGLVPVNRRFEAAVRRRAQRACPGQDMHYLGLREDFDARCVKHRCRRRNEMILGD
jgi:hypothetical protein